MYLLLLGASLMLVRIGIHFSEKAIDLALDLTFCTKNGLQSDNTGVEKASAGFKKTVEFDETFELWKLFQDEWFGC